ncbi:hypothetical protein B0H19DRAFT_1077146 [Mycena capillaripes]|nr:hypothetical protein B0H19DRAFT_1077146 [Mycena capillaripes]
MAVHGGAFEKRLVHAEISQKSPSGIGVRKEESGKPTVTGGIHRRMRTPHVTNACGLHAKHNPQSRPLQTKRGFVTGFVSHTQKTKPVTKAPFVCNGRLCRRRSACEPHAFIACGFRMCRWMPPVSDVVLEHENAKAETEEQMDQNWEALRMISLRCHLLKMRRRIGRPTLRLTSKALSRLDIRLKNQRALAQREAELASNWLDEGISGAVLFLDEDNRTFAGFDRECGQDG